MLPYTEVKYVSLYLGKLPEFAFKTCNYMRQFISLHCTGIHKKKYSAWSNKVLVCFPSSGILPVKCLHPLKVVGKVAKDFLCVNISDIKWDPLRLCAVFLYLISCAT